MIESMIVCIISNRIICFKMIELMLVCIVLLILFILNDLINDCMYYSNRTIYFK